MKYARDNNGLTHLIHPMQGEHTMCGYAFDVDSEVGEEGHAWRHVSRGPVDCKFCVMVIDECRGVKVKRP